MSAASPRLSDLVLGACAAHTTQAIEGALVRVFLDRSGLGETRNLLLRAALARPGVEEAAELLAGCASAGLSDLVAAFEVLVPSEEARDHGAVFTPSPVSTFMAREALRGLGDELRVLDPAVGCGALLVAVLSELHARSGHRAGDIVGRLHGVDLSPASLDRARMLLALACAALGDDRQEHSLNLRCADSLTVDWEPPGDGFDVIIGNPPYVRYQNLPVDRRTELAERFQTLSSGNWNLYFAFFELAHRLVRPGGKVVFITPNQFTTSLAGGPLREFLAGGRLDAVLDFGTHRVFEALAYTAITVGRRPMAAPVEEDNGSVVYLDVAGLPGLAELEDAGDDWQRLGSRTARRSLGRRPWRLVGPSHAAAIAAIGAAGRTLSDVAEVRYGVATCRDRLYICPGDRDDEGRLVVTHAGRRWPVEDGITRPLVRVPKVPDAAALAANTSRILYPYQLVGDTAVILDEADLAERYPLAYAYLSAVRDELASRDKGKKTYPRWYAYGRSQGLVPAGDKLLTPLYAASPRFLRDSDSTDLFVNGCAVVPREGTDLALLTVILSSGLCRFFVERTGVAISGGFYAYQKPQLASLGIPKLTEAQREELLAASPREADLLLCRAYGVEPPAEYIRS